MDIPAEYHIDVDVVCLSIHGMRKQCLNFHGTECMQITGVLCRLKGVYVFCIAMCKCKANQLFLGWISKLNILVLEKWPGLFV